MTAGIFQLLSESPEALKRRRASFFAACLAEVAAVGLLTVVCAYYAKTAAGHVRRYTVLTFSTSVERQLHAKPPELRRVIPRKFAPYVLPHPQVELSRISEPQIRPDIRVPAVSDEPVTPAPALAEARQLPSPPPAIHTGLFGQTPEKPVTRDTPTIQVQTGGFGTPQGIAGQAQGGNSGNVPKLGAFDMPAGAGAGNGSGGPQGRAQVIADAGFGKREAINEIDESDVSRRVATSAFGSGGVDAGGNGASAGGARGAVKTGAFAAPEPAQKPSSRQTAAAPEIRPVEILSKPSPQYTEEAKRLGVQGEVVLSVVFQADGTLKVVGVIKSLGHGLDQMAEQAAAQIRFKPAEQAGKPTSFAAMLHIEFRLA